MMRRISLGSALASLLGLAIAAPNAALAKSHQWTFTELFSNSDGSVQFIEMFVFDPAVTGIVGDGMREIEFGGRPLTSLANEFIFPANLPDRNTFEQSVLFATQSFADLPGAPTPDYIIPPNFFNQAGPDDVRYRNFVDQFPFEAGELPTDGVSSLQKDFEGNRKVGPMNPTNFSGETGSLDLSALRAPCGDANGDGSISVADVVMAQSRALGLSTPDALNSVAADVDGDGEVSFSDAVNIARHLMGAQLQPEVCTIGEPRLK